MIDRRVDREMEAVATVPGAAEITAAIVVAHAGTASPNSDGSSRGTGRLAGPPAFILALDPEGVRRSADLDEDQPAAPSPAFRRSRYR